MEDKRRLLGVQSSEEDSSEENSRTPTKLEHIIESGSSFMRWQEKEIIIIRLTGVTVLSKVEGQGGEPIVGTLEAHVHRFVYTASNLRMQFMFTDIENSFFRLGDERMRPLVHFHFRRPIKLGKETSKDIEFHLGQKRSDRDSDKIEKEKQIRDGGRNEDLKNFVDKVDARWSSQPIAPCCLFDELEKVYEFYGDLPSKISAAFALTSFNLIVLVETPFVVFPLRDIEIVNLALLRPGIIDMTVIFQDFEKDNVLQISSIPLKSLAGIKDRLNWGQVKYYVNTAEPDWKAIVKRITDFPEKFIEDGITLNSRIVILWPATRK
ncbi:hypothetical protein MKW92_011039 [Papaver armeniacum]|nr:hypothetical protein MKW92_011039 [Papaver armeniacum]